MTWSRQVLSDTTNRVLRSHQQFDGQDPRQPQCNTLPYKEALLVVTPLSYSRGHSGSCSYEHRASGVASDWLPARATT
jgi:hypothetical protein